MSERRERAIGSLLRAVAVDDTVKGDLDRCAFATRGQLILDDGNPGPIPADILPLLDPPLLLNQQAHRRVMGESEPAGVVVLRGGVAEVKGSEEKKGAR